MSTHLHNSGHESGPVPTHVGSQCDREVCRTGLCSPCLVIWGLLALWLVFNSLQGVFQ